MTDSNVLEIGTEVSAKYRGAFCEATIKAVKKLIKIRISWDKPLSGSATLTQDNVRGVLKVQNTIEGKKDGVWCPGTVLKITDASTYTVVFDDGDERTLGRNSVCPQGAKHFKEEWTLDHLPLTNPENFGTPVILDTKKQRKRRKVDGPALGRNLHYSEEDVGKVAFYDTRSKKQTLQPVLIASHSQCDEFISQNPGEVIVRSFKSGKFLSIPKEDMVRFDRETEPLQSILSNTTDIIVMKPALEKALAFYDTGVLPAAWDNTTDSHARLKEPDNLNDAKLKKQFIAGLYDFWEKKGAPITRQPSVGYHDLDLYHLYCYVTEYGGPDSVTKDMKWRSICAQMNILNIPPSGSHTVKNAYCRYVVPFVEEWENRGKRRRSEPPRSASESANETPVSSKRKARVSTPTPCTNQTRRTSTPTPGKGRRNSIKVEENDSVSSDTTDYDNMPDVHKYSIGQRVKVLYGAPKHCGSYEAKINERNIDARTDAPVYHIHYTGWNIRYDEWVMEDSILSLVTRSSKKKGTILDPPKDLKVIPNRRKIIPKYKKYKKQNSNTSETSSGGGDDKHSLPASECSEEGDAETKMVEDTPIKQEAPECSNIKQETEDHVTSSVVTSSEEVTSGVRDDKSPLLCEESFDDLVDTSVTSTQQVVTKEEVEEDKEKEEAAAILSTLIAIKPSTSFHPLDMQHVTHVTSQQHVTSQRPGGQVTNLPTVPSNHLQYAYHFQQAGAKNLLHAMPLSPSKQMYITTTGCPTQYLPTGSVRPVIEAASIAKIPGPFTGSKHGNRVLTKTGNVVVMTDAMPPQSNNSSLIMKQRVKYSEETEESNERKKGRKRKIQQADSTSDIGSRLQQFEFRPDPCEDCDKRPDERPKRAERDKARRGTVKNIDCNKTGDRTVQQPPYWVPGSVVGSNYVRSSTVPLYYTGSDVIQGGYYVPMRPPGIGPYPPGYTPKFPIPIPKSQGDVKTDTPAAPSVPSSSRDTCSAEPDSTVSDEKPPLIRRPDNTPPSAPYTTPPHVPNQKMKNTPNMDSDSSDEKATVPGMSPMIFPHSMSECSDKEGASSSKVKIFDKDFGIHLFDHMELPSKIKSMQTTMAELQKCYLFYKGQITSIEKKEREKRKAKKRKGKPRTSSISKSSDKVSSSGGGGGGSTPKS